MEDLLLLAQQSVLNGDYGTAKEQFQSIIQSGSDNSSAWYGLGVTHHSLGETDDAISAFETSYKFNKTHAATVANLAFLYVGIDDSRSSEFAQIALELGLENQQLKELIKDSADTDEPPIISAEPIENNSEAVSIHTSIENLISNKEFQSAMEIISPALENQYSSDTQIWYFCALCLNELGLEEDAINSLNYCLQLDSEFDEARDLLTTILAKDTSEDNTEPIVEDFKPIVTEEVTYAEYEPEIGEEENFEIALEDTLIVLQNKAKEATESGNHSVAIQTWKKIIQEYGSSVQSWTGMAEALESAGYVEKARQCRLKADELSEDSEDQTFTQSNVDLLSAAEEVKSTFSANNNQIEENVNTAIEWYNKGLTLLSEDKASQSLNCFEKALSSVPREETELRVRSYNGQGHALHHLGRFSESIQSYHQAISMDPASVTGRTLYNMGSSYAAMEHFSDAIKCFEQALTRDLDNDELRLCKTQMNRCSLLLKEQNKAAKLQS
jgi:tetratricopeptide (TPR) repeat protein